MARLPRLQNTRILKVTTIGNIAAPTVAELTPGAGIVAIHPFMTKDSDIGVDNSDSITEMGVDDIAKIEVPTIGSYHGDLVVFRDFDGSTFLPTATDPTKVITENLLFYLAIREGIPSATAVAAAQEWDVFQFRADKWKPSYTEDGMIKRSIHLFQMGAYKTGAVVAA